MDDNILSVTAMLSNMLDIVLALQAEIIRHEQVLEKFALFVEQYGWSQYGTWHAASSPLSVWLPSMGKWA